MNKDQILERLDILAFYTEYVPSLKVGGKPEALGLCPFHDDTNPSLSVNVETGLFRCFSCDAKGDVFTFYQKYKDCDFPTALKEIGTMAGVVKSDVKSKIVATFKYYDSEGNLLYIKERIEPGRNGRSKEFVFKHLVNGKWTLGRGCDPVLYNLPALIKSEYAFVVEGEGKVDLLNSWGFTATCLDSGANSPIKDEYVQILRSMERVIILSDNDEPGKQYASRIASALHGKVKELKIVELPGLKEAEDVIDWLRIVGNNKEKLIEIVKNVPLWTPRTCDNNSTMSLTRLDALFQEPEETTEWLADGLLPSGGFSVAVAKPKVGKSTLARMLALCVARGIPFLGRDVMQGAVIYLALEEKRSAIRRHFRDMGATGAEDIHVYSGGTPIDAIKQIRAAVEPLKPALVIIDPLFRLTRVKDTNDYAQVTNALDPLLRLARDTGTHVLCVHHANKIDGQGGNCVLGSSAIFGSVDTLIIMKRHEHYRTIETIQRYGEDLPETTLGYDKYAGIVTIGREKTEEDLFDIKEAILKFLSNQSDPVIEKVIMDEVEGRNALKRKALRELVGVGNVTREGTGGKGDPYRYSCTQKNACTQRENDSGYKQNDRENDPVKNACTLVPTITLVQEKRNLKNAEIPPGCREDSCTHVPMFPETEKNCREQAFLTKNEGENNEPFEVEFLEVIE